MRFPLFFAAMACATAAFAQQNPVTVTAADYARAEKFMGYNTNPLVYGVAGRPGWLPDGRLWYRVTRENGTEFVLIDPAKGGARGPAFDHAKLAAALTAASGPPATASKLPFQEI